MNTTSEDKNSYLTFVEEAGTKRHSDGRTYRYVKLRCACGNEKIVLRSTFVKNAIHYCSKECPKRLEPYEKEMGNTYGKYTVLKFIGFKNRHAKVLARCQCGDEKETNLSSLKNGYVSACKKCARKKEVPIGTQFDLLTVQKIYVSKEDGKERAVCSCQCGKEKDTYLHNLTRKKKKEEYVHSCGCFYKKNLIGQKFGYLTVVKEADAVEKIYKGKKHMRRRWVCNCDCGNKGKIVIQSELEMNHTRSCGCLLSKENRRNRVLGEKNPMYGKTGEKNPNWSPDKTQEIREKERKGNKNYNWRMAVYERDDYTCKCCTQKSTGNIAAHHICNYKDYPALRFDVNNGITLCTKCHNSFHSIYGKSNTTKEQLLAFINKHFPRENEVTSENLFTINDDVLITNQRIKPYVVTFPDGKVESFYTYEEIQETCGISITSALKSVKHGKPYITRKIIVKGKTKTMEFKSYSEAARYFHCTNPLIKCHIEDQNYRSMKYPSMNQFVFEEVVEEIKIKRIQ